MSQSWFSVLYNLTETHVGAAEALDAVDLPIVRESTTGLPILPETALKGVARERATRRMQTEVERLFGPEEGELRAGRLIFGQGQLLFFPLRALGRPFVHATCPLLLGRLDRLRRAFGLEALVPPELLPPPDRKVLVADEGLAGGDLLVERFGYKKHDLAHSPALGRLSARIAAVLPRGEEDTRKRLASDAILLPDPDFVALVRGALPVRARVRLDDETRTTSGGDGNLWFEEMLPSDCTFWTIISEREGKEDVSKPMSALIEALKPGVQLGGGETLGQGRCWWSFDGGGR